MSLFTRGRIEAHIARVACVNDVYAIGWHDGADALADVPDGFLFGFWVELNELLAVDIDIEQVIVPPDRTLAPLRDMFADGFECVVSHAYLM